MLKLPIFLTLPDYSPKVFTLTKEQNYGKYVLQGYESILFTSPSEAYDYACKILGGEVIFDSEDLQDAGECLGGMFIEKNDGSSGSRILFSYNAHGKQKCLENNYAYFLELDKEYRKNPNDWSTAYLWVQHHPAFYHRNINLPDYWVMDDGWNSSYVYVEKNDSKTTVFLEHGEWLPSANKNGEEYCHTVPSHDYRLDVEAENFEEAYILFAKKVDSLYDIKGEEK
jgi:hypothetical protein